MNTIELIRKKRDGGILSKEEISYMVNNFTAAKIPNYQFSAFLMAVYNMGMTTEETAFLTEAMLYSGKVINLSAIKGVKVDKHSTGGVGDKTSLIIAPIVAAAGINVPMISGRGLGHTGGTLDKLEAVPGFRTDLNLTEYKSVIKKCGAVLIGQTKEIAPADKSIYALRDVTATVESIPLITASIMSKKLAEGIDSLVLDVKTGTGAFMREMKKSTALANSLIGAAKAFDKKVIAFITDMNQPLGNYIGNWFEIYETIKVLNGEYVENLTELCLKLAGAMIHLGGKADSIDEGVVAANELLQNGKAFEKFVEITKLQGGDLRYIYEPDKYPKSRYSEKITSGKEGYIAGINNYEIGMAALELGAGRLTMDDKIDPKAGIIFHSKIGDKVTKKTIVAEIFTDRKNKIESVKSKIMNSLSITGEKVPKVKLIKKVIY
jgi:pyrimidine-nucleoside phosphorylase